MELLPFICLSLNVSNVLFQVIFEVDYLNRWIKFYFNNRNFPSQAASEIDLCLKIWIEFWIGAWIVKVVSVWRESLLQVHFATLSFCALLSVFFPCSGTFHLRWLKVFSRGFFSALCSPLGHQIHGEGQRLGTETPTCLTFTVFRVHIYSILTLWLHSALPPKNPPLSLADRCEGCNPIQACLTFRNVTRKWWK